MKVLIDEDNTVQADWTQDLLMKKFPAWEIQHVETESEFRSQLPDLQRAIPDLILMDVMLKWCHDSFDMKKCDIPDDERKRFFRAGFRCLKMLLDDSRTANIPVIMYTSLSPASLPELSGLPSTVAYLQKDSDSDSLFRLGRSLL